MQTVNLYWWGKHMTETGVVKNISQGQAVVAIIRKSACGESCKGCSGGCKLSENCVNATNEIGAKCGDVVVVETSTKGILSKAFIVYILPLIVFFAGYFISFALFDNEAAAALIDMVLFAVVFFILHIFDKKGIFKTEVKVKEIKKWNIQ